MKKILISIAVVGFFIAGTSNKAQAVPTEFGPCRTISRTCPNGASYTAIVCSYWDTLVWDDIYCGISPE